jgi:integrase
MAKRKAAWSKTVEEHGQRVRLYERPNGQIYRAVVTGRTVSASGKERPVEDRRSLKHSDRDLAESQARELCKALATQRLTGASPDTLTLAQLFGLYERERLPSLKRYRQTYARSCFAMFEEAWGADQPVADIGQGHVDRYCELRRAGKLFPPAHRKPESGGKPPKGYRSPEPVRDGTLHANLTGFLSPVFNWANRQKRNGRRILNANPLHDCVIPREKNPRRPVASHQRYIATQEHADTVDPAGRLRCVLALARYTGRRESAICQLRASDVLLSPARVRAALAAEGMDERIAEHMPHGAIRWAADTDKEGLLLVTALSRDARVEVDRYLPRNPRVGDVPLFPAPGPIRSKKKPAPVQTAPEKPLSKETAYKWLVKAEGLAELPKLKRGAFHAFRRLWASERKHLPDVDVSAAGGWKDPATMKRSYQQADAATMLRVMEAAG